MPNYCLYLKKNNQCHYLGVEIIQGQSKREQETHQSANPRGNVIPGAIMQHLKSDSHACFLEKNPSGRAAVKQSGVKEAMKIGGRGKVVRRMQISLHPRLLVLHRVHVFVS